MDKIDQNISTLKCKIKPSNSNPVFKQIETIKDLEDLHKKFVFVPIDKASNNVAMICIKFYVEVILKEIGVIGGKNDTYKLSQKNSNEIIQNNLEYS